MVQNPLPDDVLKPRSKLSAFVLGFEIVAFIIVILMACFLGLMWRLSQGPIDVSFLARKLEQSINQQQSQYQVSFGQTDLVWGEAEDVIMLDIKDMTASTVADKKPIFAIKRVGLEISKPFLFLGRVYPVSVTLYDPTLKIMRDVDGGLTFDITTLDHGVNKTVYGPERPQMIEKKETQRFVYEFLSALDQRNALSKKVISQLEKIRIVNAKGMYLDFKNDMTWQMVKADFILARGEGRTLLSSFQVDLLVDGEITSVQGNGFYGFESHIGHAQFDFKGLNPLKLSKQGGFLKELSRLTMPLDGQIEARFSYVQNAFDLKMARAILSGTKGYFSLPEAYDETPVPIENFSVMASYDSEVSRFMIHRIEMQLTEDNARFEGKLMARQSSTDKSWLLEAEAFTEDLPQDKLKLYWPHKLYPISREWVTTRLSKGMISKATVKLSAERIGVKDRPIQINELSGVIDFKNMTVDYLPDLFKATNVSGQAVYTDKDIIIKTKNAKANDIDIKNAIVKLSSAHPHVMAEIELDIEGALSKSLMFIDQKPLKLLESFAKKPSDLQGDVEGKIKLAFPVYHGLRKEEVDVEIVAKGFNVGVENITPDLSFAQGDFQLTLDQNNMRLNGTARFNNNIQTSPVRWHRQFYPAKDEYVDKIETSFDLTTIFLSRHAHLSQIDFQGRAPTDVIYKSFNDQKASVDLNINLTPASFRVDFLNYLKPLETSAHLALSLRLVGQNLSAVEKIKLEGEGMSIEGRASFDSTTQLLQSADFSQFKFGRTDITAQVKPSENGFDVSLNGAVLDASGFINDQKTSQMAARPQAQIKEKKKPLSLSVKADKIYTDQNKALDNAVLKLSMNDIGRLTLFNLDAMALNNPLKIYYGPKDTAEKPYVLSIHFQDAGSALSTLGITQSVRGGTLIVNGEQKNQANQSPYDIQGFAVLSNFRVKDAPILARLVSAVSLSGITDLLSGDGVKFEKAETQIYLTSRIAPFEADETVKKLAFVKGRTTGSELGLTFNGSLDLQKNFYDLEGTIVPVSTLNKIVSNLPIVGRILSGGSDAVFAATYKVKGSTKDPEVTVNPIAALAPGVLRKMFFE